MQVERTLQLVQDAEILSEEEAASWAEYWAEQGGDPEDGDGLTAALEEQQIITSFQGDAIRKGVPGPYKVGPYRIFDRVAGGRLGSVYRAVHEEFDQPVALKVYPADIGDDPERAMRLARETRIAVQVDHPNVVRTYQVGRVGESVFLSIEDLEGCTLQEDIATDGALDPVDACRLIREVALGLQHLHELEVVHRDIKPSNIWITESDHAKLMEFGAARDALADLVDRDDDDDDAMTLMRPELLGTLDYTSAEQAANESSADARSDIYSLGCVLFEALTGRVVFPDVNAVRKMARHASEIAPVVAEINEQVSTEISDVVATMLAKKPEDRFQTAKDAAWALEQVIDLEEKEDDIEAEINPSFLEWARANSESAAEDELQMVAADPGFISFVDELERNEENAE